MFGAGVGLLSAAASLLAHPSEALALPFKKDCASMQSWFNNKSWKDNARFQGFENEKFEVNPFPIQGGAYMCQRGYITTSTPMGTKVCLGFISYQEQDGGIWASSKDGTVWSNFKDKGSGANCRWR